MFMFWKSKYNFGFWHVVYPDVFYYHRVRGYRIRSITLYDWLRLNGRF